MIATRIFFTLLLFVSVISDGFGKPHSGTEVTFGYLRKTFDPGCHKGYCWQYCIPKKGSYHFETDWCYLNNDDNDDRFYEKCSSESDCRGTRCASYCSTY